MNTDIVPFNHFIFALFVIKIRSTTFLYLLIVNILIITFNFPYKLSEIKLS